MWPKGIMNVTRIKCILVILGLSLTQAFGGDADPEESGKRIKLGSATVEHRYNGSSLAVNPISTTTQTRKQSFNWDDVPKGHEVLDDGKEFFANNLAAELEVVPPAMNNKPKSYSTLASTSIAKNSSQVISATSKSTIQRKGRGKGVERRRRMKQLIAVMSRGRDGINVTSSGLEGASRGLGIGEGVNARRTKKERLHTKRRVRVQSRRRKSNANIGGYEKLKESRERRKKLRLERRRRRDRERKRRNKINHDSSRGRGRKLRKQQPAALFLDPEFNARKSGTELFVRNGTEPKYVTSQQRDDPQIKEQNSSSLQKHPKDNVEKVFSKQFERELSKTEHGSSKFKSSQSSEPSTSIEEQRFGGEKILGYSQSDNELPFDDDDEILSNHLKRYRDYLTNGLRLPKFPGPSEFPWYSLTGNSNLSGLASGQDPGPYQNKDRNAEEIGTEIPAVTTEEDHLKGDLSCMNGTFLPAPLARHALIKYVKSSTPGHEYLEADYECTPGYSMATPARRLLCKNRRWVGAMPKCKLRQDPNDVCADSPCEQICGEVNGSPTCACYQGFRQEGTRCIDINECDKNNGGCEFGCRNTAGSYRCECPKGMRQGENKYRCMDINECILNNGHGPCQDTCLNLEQGYRCSCEGLPGTILGPNNHTCQDAGPCGTENAGCSHTCLSTMGRVFCLCPDGFMLEDDWKTCQDVDECAVPDLQTVVCQHGCINTPGSYRCADPPEMRDEPSDLVSKNCDPGFEPSVDGVCVDINECSISNGGCLEVCENTAGSYFCACNGDERLLSADGRTCEGITDVACPALNPSGRGYVMCSRLTTPKPWRGRKRVINRPGTKCFLRCPSGYQLRGEYELTCGTNGNWIGSKHGECVRYSKPRLDCPPNLVAEVPPGQTEAFVTFAQPSTDLDWFRYVRSEPSWGTRLEANLLPGEHKITFIAKHPVSKKQATCTLRITIKPGEAPRIKNCPDNILALGTNDTIVTWTEPIFTDNVKISNIISNKSPGHSFPVGQHKIRYEASDEAGWTAACEFLVTIKSD